MKRIRYLTLLWMLFCGIVCWAQFNPESPDEPGQLKTKLILKVSPDGTGYTNGGGYFLAGTKVTVTATANSDWVFVNWTNENGEQVSTSSSYTFKKGNRKETLTANFSFNPSDPSEPGELPYKLTLLHTEGGYVSGGGYYLGGTTVNIRATPNDNYAFVGWYKADGSLYSSVAETTYKTSKSAATLTAKFTFNPESPSEPNEVNIYRLKLKAGDGGTVSPGTTYLKEGESVTINAYANSGYSFDGWYQDNTKISSEESFVYTMGNGYVTLEARFQYQPDNPDEPGEIKQRKFSFLLKNTITKPGTKVQFPILLTPLATLGDMTFQLNFDSRLDIDFENMTVGKTTTPYTVTREQITEGPTYNKGYTSYKFTLTGGSMVVNEGETPTVTPILTFPFIIADDIQTKEAYRISINQIVMTNEDGSTQTAGTRQGLVSVYKLGDSNGDNKVDIKDKINAISYLLGDSPKVFIKEVGDVNNDNEITVTDALVVDGLMEPSGDQSSE